MIDSVAGFISAAPAPWTIRARDQHAPRCWRGPQASDAGGEDDDPDDEDQAPAVRVGELAADQHQRGERQRVAGDDPLERREVGAEIALDRRQRDVHDGVVEHDHEEAERHGGERPPLPLGLWNDAQSHVKLPFSVRRQKLVRTRLVTAANTGRRFTWSPTPEQLATANVTRLAGRLGCDGFAELQRFSVEEPERFWPAVVDDLGLEFSQPVGACRSTTRTGSSGRAGSSAAGSTWPGSASTAGPSGAAGRGGGGLAGRGRRAALADLARALARGLSRLAEGLGLARRRPGRRGRDLPADVARGRDRLARRRAARRGAGADLLRLRRAGGRRPPRGRDARRS